MDPSLGAPAGEPARRRTLAGNPDGEPSVGAVASAPSLRVYARPGACSRLNEVGDIGEISLIARAGGAWRCPKIGRCDVQRVRELPGVLAVGEVGDIGEISLMC
ncbi:MAG: hypothetical protein ACTHU0_27005 [Kofleriaceae bacterium]